jgi:STE24 endopeptidase
MDATKRTRHTNAYFTGLGRAKRVVLFDSLIAAHSHEEILAILAHEIGHLKKNHIKKHLMMTGMISFLLLFIASKLLAWDMMYNSFGFVSASDYVGLFLIGVLWEPVGFFLTPIGMAISRWFEREADFYAINTLKTAKDLSKALKKMARENLINLRPHPYYVYLNYSHPPMLQRIEFLESAAAFQKEK